MNEQIKQLAIKVGGTQKYVPAPGVWQFFDDELEKFADAIVKECAYVAMNKDTGIENGLTVDKECLLAGRAIAYKTILKHFNFGNKNGKSTQTD